MKTIEVGTRETVYRDVYIEIDDDLYNDLLENPYRTDLTSIENQCLSKIDQGEINDEDYEFEEITHIIETKNWDVLYD